MISPVDSISIAELEPARPHHSHVSACAGAVGRYDDVAASDDLLALDSGTERDSLPVAVAPDDFAALRGDDAVAGLDGLARVQMNDSESLLVGHLDVMPVGWNPRRVLIFSFDD